MPFQETITALSTPSGRSAIALIRVSGPLAEAVCAQALNCADPKARVATLRDYKARSNVVLDQILFTYFPLEQSYTGEPLLEINCHGNPLIVQKILEDLLERGCRMAEPGEFTRTAFLNGKMDLVQAEAVCDLIRAQSDLALEYAQKQLKGELSQKIHAYTDSLIGAVADIEAYIDFPEEDLPVESFSRPIAVLEDLLKQFRELIEHQHYRTLVQEGLQTVILGMPNVGKSSLMNTLLGQERALVSEIPGTTRDFIKETLYLDSFCLKVIDTAGIHPTTDKLESMGIDKTLDNLETADFFLWVVDHTEPFPEWKFPHLNRLKPENACILLNKQDLKKHPAFKIPEHYRELPCYALSLKEQTGVSAFRAGLKNQIGALLLQTGGSEPMLLNTRRSNGIKKATLHLKAALEHFAYKGSVELAALELRAVMEALGEIVGKIDNEQVLDKVFEKFCIGK